MSLSALYSSVFIGNSRLQPATNLGNHLLESQCILVLANIFVFHEYVLMTTLVSIYIS